jgi:hypothetical protein
VTQIAFVGPSYNLRRRQASVQRTVNLVPVPQEPGNERTKWVFKDAPGLQAFFVSVDLELLRITEDGQGRITESGDDRAIED